MNKVTTVSENEVALRMRKYLRASFLDLYAAADHYGVSVSTVSAWQTGRALPNAHALSDIGVAKVVGFVQVDGGETC